MIPPYPYKSGLRFYPIIGYHNSIYNVTASDIEDNIADATTGTTGRAYILNGRTETVPTALGEFDLDLTLDIEFELGTGLPIIHPKWLTWLDAPHPQTQKGFMYLVLPALLPQMPIMDKQSSTFAPTIWSNLSTWLPGNFDLNWALYDSIGWPSDPFSFGGVYLIYRCRGFGVPLASGTPKAEEMMDINFKGSY